MSSALRALAYEVAAAGVTAKAVCPGPIETPMLRSLPQACEEVAPVFVLLASEQGSYFVGSTLNVNGGDYVI